MKCVDISDLVSVNVQKCVFTSITNSVCICEFLLILMYETYFRPLLADNPDVVIGTPSRVLAHIKSKNLVLKNSLKMLVIDEADLMFAFGFEKDTKDVLRLVLLKLYY